MNSSTCTIIGTSTRNIAAAISAGGALMGYAILNLATKDKLGLGLAIAAAFFSSTLNAIFHSLAVQRIGLREDYHPCANAALLTTSAVAATLGTGYIYASSREAVLTTISPNNTTAMSIALIYQLSWVLPISLVLYSLTTKAITAVAHYCSKKSTDDKTIPLLTDSDKIATDVDAESSINTAGKAQKTTPIRNCATITLQLCMVAFAAICTAAFITNSSQAAYQLLKDKPDDHRDDNPNIIDLIYKEIYGKSIVSAIAAHLAQAPWVLMSGIEGLGAMKDCFKDLYLRPSIEKAFVAMVALGVVGFTCIATYLIATYGQNSETNLDLSILIFALTTAFIGNAVSAIKYAQGVLGLVTQGPRIGWRNVTDKGNALSFKSEMTKPEELRPASTDNSSASISPNPDGSPTAAAPV